MQSIDNKVISRIYGTGRGAVFSPSDFSDLGSRTTVATALKRHKQAGIIRQVARGLYDLPRKDPVLGLLSPRLDSIAKALAKRDAARLQAAGGSAAHALGLTDQVPMRVVYLTDGRARHVQVGKSLIVFRKVSLRQMAAAGRVSGDVIQALRWLGRDHIDDQIIVQLRKVLTPSQKAKLLKDLRLAPIWVADIMRRIAQKGRA